MIRVIAECITCQFLIYSRSGFLLVNVICLQCMKDGGYFSLIEVIFSFNILNYLKISHLRCRVFLAGEMLVFY